MSEITRALLAVRMNPFPENWELIELFEAEPELANPELGSNWAYNTLTFSTVRNEDRVRCVIEPGESFLQLEWSRNGKEIVSLVVRWVSGMTIEGSNGKEVLVVIFDSERLLPLRVQLKPSVHVFWGTGE